MTESAPIRGYRFDAYEADLRTAELRRNGARLKLQEQPFRVLAMLLERSGELVTREELRQRLWPADTFVDFDHSLNTAVAKIRDALQDSAAQPRYIETLAKRGYRFLGQVEPLSSPAPSRVVTGQPSAAEEEAPDLPRTRRRTARMLFGALQVMYLLFYVVALARLGAIQDMVVALWWLRGTAIVALVLATAAVGIPLRLYLLTAAGFDFRGLGRAFRVLFPFLLLLDMLWALAPFFLAPRIGVGLALAACAALLYAPFSQRTLVRMAYGSGGQEAVSS